MSRAEIIRRYTVAQGKSLFRGVCKHRAEALGTFLLQRKFTAPPPAVARQMRARRQVSWPRPQAKRRLFHS